MEIEKARQLSLLVELLDDYENDLRVINNFTEFSIRVKEPVDQVHLFHYPNLNDNTKIKNIYDLVKKYYEDKVQSIITEILNYNETQTYSKWYK